jgi:hypothetical protein
VQVWSCRHRHRQQQQQQQQQQHLHPAFVVLKL